MARPIVTPPFTPASQAVDNAADKAGLPDADVSVPADPGKPIDLPMIPVEQFANAPDLDDLHEDGEPDLSELLPF